MEKQPKTYEFLYENYSWPEPGAERQCPFSGIPLQLNEKKPGYNGKPWTCPQCIWYFSEEELEKWDPAKHENCPHLQELKQAQPADNG